MANSSSWSGVNERPSESEKLFSLGILRLSKVMEHYQRMDHFALVLSG